VHLTHREFELLRSRERARKWCIASC
jgi:hypothetical protein